RHACERRAILGRPPGFPLWPGFQRVASLPVTGAWGPVLCLFSGVVAFIAAFPWPSSVAARAVALAALWRVNHESFAIVRSFAYRDRPRLRSLRFWPNSLCVRMCEGLRIIRLAS